MKNNTIFSIGVVVSYAVMITINTLANTLPINGKLTGELSDVIGVLFVPAGYVFIIWLPIFVTTGMLTVYQALPKQRDNERITPNRWLLIVNFLLNGIWLLTWHYQQVEWSVVVMMLVFATLATLYVQVGTGQQIGRTQNFWFVRLPISLYFGWICVALIANVSAALVVSGWNSWGLSDITWTAIMIGVAGTIGLGMLWYFNDYVFGAVIAWALFGLGFRHVDINSIQFTAYTVVGMLVFTMCLIAFKHESLKRRSRVDVAQHQP